VSSRRWLVLTVRVPSDELRDELAEGLVALGGTAVEEEVDLLTTYLPEPPEPEPFLASAADRLARIAGAEPEILWRWQDDEDWSARWKEGLGPREVGPRIVVTQPWNPVEPAEDRIVIVIEPASAFGTGEHPTTRGALRLLQDEVRGGERVLDVGSGTAILSIAAVALGAGRVLAAESDAGAMGTARENVDRAGVSEAVELVNVRVDEPWLASVAGAGFDLIVANVLSGILVPLLPAFLAALRPDGRVILGGIMEAEADAVVTAGEAAGLERVRVDREGEWWTGLFRAARSPRPRPDGSAPRRPRAADPGSS
jgi:ribosomal protein L11 methyltransferase